MGALQQAEQLRQAHRQLALGRQSGHRLLDRLQVLGRAKELEERLAREIGRDPALVAERALKRNCGAAQGNAA